MRKTKSMLEDLCKKYSYETGKTYYIYQAYGGYQLLLKDGYGAIEITGFLKAGEMYTVLNALISAHF